MTPPEAAALFSLSIAGPITDLGRSDDLQRALRKLAAMMRTSLLLFCVGVAILFFSVWSHQQHVFGDTVVANVFAEGLTVAAWVALWNALATFLINWAPQRRQMPGPEAEDSAEGC